MSTESMRPTGRSTCRSRQQGVVLLVALVFLVMLTVIGIAMFGTTTAEEKMSRNYRDYNLAMQAAEAALRDAEVRVTGYWVYGGNASATPQPVDPLYFAGDCSNGLCSPAATQPVYSNYSMTASPSVGLGSCPGGCDGKGNGSGTGSPTLPSGLVAQQPRYLIEAITWYPPGSSLSDPTASKQAYRITAVGFGRSATTRVMLQEIFLPY